MTYTVRIEQFEGPFDLLLQLITRRQLDIHDLDLAAITGDFIAHLQQVGTTDLETATSFLVVAATLIELKALRLLPDPEPAEELLREERDLLYARLLEYRAFRGVAEELATRWEQHAACHPREVPPDLPARPRLVEHPLPVDADGLARLAAAALTPAPPVPLQSIRRAYLSIERAMSLILSGLPVGARTTLRELTGARPLPDRIAVFLAVLELYRHGAVELHQPTFDAPLEIVRAADPRPAGGAP